MSEPTYTVQMTMKSNWIVGYHPELDEMFLYFVDQDDLCWVFTRNGLDAVGFYEFMDMSKGIILGDL